MKLRKAGRSTSKKAEVVCVTPHGLWVAVGGCERYISYDRHPWFKNATIVQVSRVRLLGRSHLRWPDLDVDLEFESLTRPEKHPLIYKSAGFVQNN